MTRKEIDAVMFKHESIPSRICDSNPELKKIGIFRIFDCTPDLVQAGICQAGQAKVRERISYCKEGVQKYFGVKDSDLERILREAGIRD